MVDQSNSGHGPAKVVLKSNRKRNRSYCNGHRSMSNSIAKGQQLETSLLYYQISPNFCNRNQSSAIPGNLQKTGFFTLQLRVLFKCYFLAEQFNRYLEKLAASRQNVNFKILILVDQEFYATSTDKLSFFRLL